MSGVLHVQESSPRGNAAPPQSFALWHLGFRSLYLQASVVAALLLAAQLLVLAAAVVRVDLPLLRPTAMTSAMLASALSCSDCVGLYAWHDAPLRVRPRLDGRPG